MSDSQHVVIIIPTYNERENCERLIPLLFDEMFPPITSEGYQLSVLVVDDTSPDKTANAIKKLKKRYPNLHLLTNPEKAGLGKAYTLGMHHALNKLKADIIFEMDADLSHDPEKIKPMLQKLQAGYDMVLGSRYSTGGSIPENWGMHRKFLSIAGNKFMQFILLNFSINDWTTGYRAIKASVIKAVLPKLTHDKFNGYTFQIGFLHQALRANFKIGEVPFHFTDRTMGQSKLGTEYIINTLRYILKVRLQELMRHRVMKFAAVGGFGAFIQLTSLTILRQLLPYQLAVFLSIETSIVSNFTWNNLWTFSDRQLKVPQIPLKFIQFNLTSAGSIIIQQLSAFIGQYTFGFVDLFTVPIINFTVDTGLMYVVIGIGLGMIWNFFAYNKFIWKKKPAVITG